MKTANKKTIECIISYDSYSGVSKKCVEMATRSLFEKLADEMEEDKTYHIKLKQNNNFDPVKQLRFLKLSLYVETED